MPSGSPHTSDPTAISPEDAARESLARRGLHIPETDLADVLAAVQGLGEVVRQQAAALPMQAVAEPFQAHLKALAAPRLETRPETLDAQGLFAGHFSSVEWVRDCLQAMQTCAPGPLAWRRVDGEAAIARARQLDEERTRGQVRGPLHGVPVGLKDMFDRAGQVSGWGSPLREGALAATSDSAVVRRLDEAGAIILGTQHMAEFALSPTGLNVSLGPGRNPLNTDHVCGGSSSGAGMSVGAGHVPLAIGSDTGGSVRLPAALCGVTGLKPTQYRLSLAGAMPLSPSLDCPGPVALTAQACAWAFAALAGWDANDLSTLDLPPPTAADLGAAARPLCLAVPRLEPSALVSPAMVEAFDEARRALQQAGVHCIDAKLPDLDLYGRLASVLLAVESSAMHRGWLQDRDAAYGRQVRRRLSRGLLMPGIDYHDAQRLRAPLLRQFLAECLGRADALLLPTAPGVAPRVDDTTHGDEARLERELGHLSFWTRGINYLGVPALSVPAGVGADGLALGVQFVGRPMADTTVLAFGQLFQQHTDWHRRLHPHLQA